MLVFSYYMHVQRHMHGVMCAPCVCRTDPGHLMRVYEVAAKVDSIHYKVAELGPVSQRGCMRT
jgi:hypothetical protein